VGMQASAARDSLNGYGRPHDRVVHMQELGLSTRRRWAGIRITRRAGSARSKGPRVDSPRSDRSVGRTH